MRNVVHALVCATALGFGAPAIARADCLSEAQYCTTEHGEYRIAVPEGEGPFPAVLFLHGAGGTGDGTMRNAGMRDALLARGYALIAPSSMPRPGRNGGVWSFHPDRTPQRDELAFFDEIAADAAERFGIDRNRIILAGFSVGGSMASYAACADNAQFSAYAPVAGSFWRPHPETCAGPVRLFHTHGWTDSTVPLEGRPLRNFTLIQGDVFHAMDIWRQTNGCINLRADRMPMDGDFWRRVWTRCTQGSALEFALFPGGHRVPDGWADMVIDWYEGL